ncbi:MAG TPA: 1-deoxy-D-xylulose-5-phosphate reductoisomerase, partial [Flavisolibacter sp.]|nr:1-deoxy-D-xylulose-5-phosphate reductoisomerase [Flavisolibacter sp.]
MNNSTLPRKRIAIFGSTGSIGTQALDVIDKNKDRFSVEVLTCNGNDTLIIQQALQFRPNIVVVTNDQKYSRVKEALSQ